MKDMQSKEHQLQQYKSLGESFETLVEEYTKISQEIKEKSWTLTELQKEGSRDLN